MSEKYKITDTRISEEIGINLSTISLWKKTKPLLYNHIRKGFLYQMELEDLKAKEAKYNAIKSIVKSNYESI